MVPGVIKKLFSPGCACHSRERQRSKNNHDTRRGFPGWRGFSFCKAHADRGYLSASHGDSLHCIGIAGLRQGDDMGSLLDVIQGNGSDSPERVVQVQVRS